MRRLFWIVLAAIGLGLVLLMAAGDSGTVLGLQDDAFASTLYYGVWGLVVAAALLGSGLRFGHAVRTMAIWLAAILALMAAYQYRYELQDVASRLTAGLIPGSPMALVDDDGKAAVMVDRLANGHFELRVRVNGAELPMMVDTGATSTVLTARDAARAGYDVAGLAFDVPISTANGRAAAARVTADEIRVGAIVRSRVPVLVAEEGRLERSLLGMNFIGTLSGFDMRGERLILRD